MALGATKLTEGQVKIIKELLKEGDYTHKAISDMFGVSRSLISLINTDKRWNEPKKQYVKKSNDFRQFTEPNRNRTIDKVILRYTDGTELELR